MSISYNPFGKDISNIDGKDLLVLKHSLIQEGLYIDYKEQVPDDLAKHVCAFANQFGGWILLGVKEDGKNRTVESFEGIPIENLSKTQDLISVACNAQSTPPIHFQTQVIHGPVDEIQLGPKKFLILVQIPESKSPPHIHKKGSIYQRLDHQSEVIKDRFSLDKLYEKSAYSNKQLTSFINNYSEEYEGCFLEVFLLSNPSLSSGSAKSVLLFDDFKSILSGNTVKHKKTVFLPYDAFQTSVGGYTARQVSGSSLTQPTLKFRWWNNGNLKFTIPMNKFSYHDFISLPDQTDIQKKFCNLLLSEHMYEGVKILMAPDLIGCILASYIQADQLMQITKNENNFFYILKIKGAEGAVPFLASKNYLDHIAQNKLPLCSEKHIQIPTNIRIPDLLSCNRKSDTESDKGIQGYYHELFWIYFELFQSLGALSGSNPFLDVYDLLDLPYTSEFAKEAHKAFNLN